ncbi:uncharacterized protein [Choristoneura fumiferana]|uniref:uncharacterized protein n=1 Tax=Choristoneura fumiferana TaxID=7141 RepID=UPI003D159187
MNILRLDFLVHILLVQYVGGLLNETFYKSDFERVLSRRKRFIVFPEGSSFQLVFCVQTAALIPIGDIFLYGNTAAIAWNLPSDPKLFQMFKDQVRVGQRRGDQQDPKHIYYLDEDGKLIKKVPYKRTNIINPVFAKRSTDKLSYKEKLRLKIERSKMHEKRLKEDFLGKKHMDRHSIEFHRNSRLSLFEKLETFLSAMGQDGRQCVLYKLCTAGQPYVRQGPFLQELLRVIFTLPKGSEENEEYDKAHTSTKACETLYPGCDDLRDDVDHYDIK